MYLDKFIVATKFAPPHLGASQIVRNQLLETLNGGRRCKLTLVPGSAGFGKTTLMTQWRRQLVEDGVKVAWLSLSPDENSPPSFHAHLFAALAKLGLAIADETAENRSPDAVVAGIVNQLAAMDEDLYLILDDYHHIEDASAHALVQKLVELNPGNLHVVIASRVIPPLSLGRLRVMGQVSEIACNDLPFDLSETRAFLGRDARGVGLKEDEIERIHDLTRGWPACLQLVSMMLKNRSARRAALADLASLQAYISENFMARLPAELVEFMESLSICDRFNADLAAAVSGAAAVGDLLHRIEGENLLMVRTESDDGSPWFRFHPLFAEFLSGRLRRRDPAAVEGLHRRASAWCARKGLVQEAVKHACLGRDLETATSIFEQAAPSKWGLNFFGPLLYTPFATSKDKTLRERFVLAYFIGHQYLVMDGRYAEAEQLLADNPAPAGQRNEVLAINVDRLEVFWLLYQGRVVEAERAGSALFARAAATHGRQSACANHCAVPLAEIMLELNRVEEAKALLAPRLHMLTGAPGGAMLSATLTKARLDWIQGQEEAALALLHSQAEHFAAIGYGPGRVHLLAEKVRFHMLAGRRRGAADAVEQLSKIDPLNWEVAGFRSEIEGVTALARARLLAFDGEHDAALDALATVRARAGRRGRGRALVMTELVAARVHEAAGRPEEASAHLVAAVERAAALGLVRTVAREGEPVLEMLRRLRAQEGLSLEVERHLDLLLGLGTAPPVQSARPANATITPRQLQILGLAATGMSNKRIALALDIAPETVKWNLKDVYSKLKVSSRYDATNWARDRGLIQ
jgi:ATP/maltotriose-dependent transcriptional regulator MalT